MLLLESKVEDTQKASFILEGERVEVEFQDHSGGSYCIIWQGGRLASQFTLEISKAEMFSKLEDMGAVRIYEAKKETKIVKKVEIPKKEEGKILYLTMEQYNLLNKLEDEKSVLFNYIRHYENFMDLVRMKMVLKVTHKNTKFQGYSAVNWLRIGL